MKHLSNLVLFLFALNYSVLAQPKVKSCSINLAL